MSVLVTAAGFADLFSVKEDAEVLNAKKAAFLASKVMQNFVVEKIEDIIDKNKKVKHIKLSGKKRVLAGCERGSDGQPAAGPISEQLS